MDILVQCYTSKICIFDSYLKACDTQVIKINLRGDIGDSPIIMMEKSLCLREKIINQPFSFELSEVQSM